MSIVIKDNMTPIDTTWIDICPQSELVENSGVCAILPSLMIDESIKLSVQIALFSIPSMNSVFAVSNWDPVGKANVMYRGIIGSIDDEPMVTSPLYKQHFSLVSGKCFEQNDVALIVYPSRIHKGKVQVSTHVMKGVE
jgi:nitrite reductase (NADH) small subunit